MGAGSKYWIVMLCWFNFTRIVLSVEFVPELFFIDLERPITQELIVSNDTTEPIRYEVSIVPQVGKEWEDRTILEEWVRYYPKIISVRPMSEGIVRFRVTPPKGLGDGEYKGQIFLKQMSTKQNIEEVILEEDKLNVSLEYMYNYTFSIYGQKGQREYSGHIEKFNVIEGDESNKISLEINNSGNASLRALMIIRYLDEQGNQLKAVEEDGSSIDERSVFLSVVPLNIVKEVEVETEKFPEGTRLLEVEFHHYDFKSKENTYKIYEKKHRL